MPWTVFNLYANLPAFMLVVCRIGGLVLAAPLFSSAIIPIRIKILLTLAMAAAVFPLVSVHLVGPVTLETALVGLFGELAIGLLVGLCLSLMLIGVQVAAEFISHQAGILFGSTYNPMMDSSESVLSQFFYFAALLGFLAIGGHRHLVRALLESFETLPPLAFRLSEGLMELILDLTTMSFEMAIRISGPVVVSLMLALLALGFISRTVPQLNILTVGFPLKLALALLVLGLTVMSMEPLLIEAFDTSLQSVRSVLGLPPQA
ncbi:MAG TPA: flagellar biosynthetic protein FliR [Phycisphaerae bacterium]|nr:flagellar biosynthetic protein FliR [Phycisphaerae bacterium]HOJ74307.1 flagellar biosynthetic protein FliR [Phycisphaerae bacterium]HOM51386.1 flagellar biosynthetic protein FliR [Phycisphaerae bacterium]HON67130.1 flagellar biosynthetic protein FliR [Phycisphaerae bacterium]HOQ84983.1 flagellar biosynthetic protein FliR [Phycisphaerae bacterium]